MSILNQGSKGKKNPTDPKKNKSHLNFFNLINWGRKHLDKSGFLLVYIAYLLLGLNWHWRAVDWSWIRIMDSSSLQNRAVYLRGSTGINFSHSLLLISILKQGRHEAEQCTLLVLLQCLHKAKFCILVHKAQGMHPPFQYRHRAWHPMAVF